LYSGTTYYPNSCWGRPYYWFQRVVESEDQGWSIVAMLTTEECRLRKARVEAEVGKHLL